MLHHSSAVEAAVTAAGLETLFREGHRVVSLRSYGSSFLDVLRASNFPKMNVGHGSQVPGCRGGDLKEMAQLTDDESHRCFYERINGGNKFGVPLSSVVTVSCKGVQGAGWTPTGARA